MLTTILIVSFEYWTLFCNLGFNFQTTIFATTKQEEAANQLGRGQG
jgi:hypothetical protein